MELLRVWDQDIISLNGYRFCFEDEMTLLLRVIRDLGGVQDIILIIIGEDILQLGEDDFDIEKRIRIPEKPNKEVIEDLLESLSLHLKNEN